MDLWKDDLSDEEADELIDKAVEEIKKRKLEVPATLFFEMHKPLSYVGSQAAVVFSPFLVPFLGFERINNYSRVLAKRDSIEKLLRRLEEKSTPERKDD